MYSGVTEPFCVGRDAEVLLFDFSIVLSCMKKNENLNVLDFAGGTGWVAELLNRFVRNSLARINGGAGTSVIWPLTIKDFFSICIYFLMSILVKLSPS